MQNSSINKLISTISKLPGLGPRSARRIVLQLIKTSKDSMLELSALLKQTAEEIKVCKNCGNIDVEEICSICKNPDRDESIICVVENVSDLWALERSQLFKGKYHILGGTLSAIDNRSPETLNFESLKKRVANNNVKEVIIATNATLEGQTTGYYIVDILSAFEVKVSRLAHGIPMGAELEYMDEGTLNFALKMRQNF